MSNKVRTHAFKEIDFYPGLCDSSSSQMLPMTMPIPMLSMTVPIRPIASVMYRPRTTWGIGETFAKRVRDVEIEKEGAALMNNNSSGNL
jgi:hypothetical protein